MSDTTSDGGRGASTNADVHRLEQILQRSARVSENPQSEPPGRPLVSGGSPRRSPGPSAAEVEVQAGSEAEHDRQEQVQHRWASRIVVEDLECSALETALKEQVYRLAGQWEQGAQRLTNHLQDALQDLSAVRQQENDLLKRRVDLCHQELEDQIAELERSFQLKVEECRQHTMARIADQKADCEMAIKAKAESLLGVLEQVDAVPSSSGRQLRSPPTDPRASHSNQDHRLAHAACACYDNDDELQYSTAEAGSAQAAGSWSAGQPMRRRLNYLVPTSIQDRSIPLAVQKYMHKAAEHPQEWWKPARLSVPDSRSKPVTRHSPLKQPRDDLYDSPATERLAALGMSFRKYRPSNCRTRSGMLAPRPPLRLSHLLEQSDDDS